LRNLLIFKCNQQKTNKQTLKNTPNQACCRAPCGLGSVSLWLLVQDRLHRLVVLSVPRCTKTVPRKLRFMFLFLCHQDQFSWTWLMPTWTKVGWVKMWSSREAWGTQ
jgi:hypothetical protein